MSIKKSNWLWGVILTILGIIMLAAPKFVINLVVSLLGLAIIVKSIYNIIDAEKNFEESAYRKMVLIKSIAGIIFGVLATVFSLPFAEKAWTAVFYIFAIALILSALFGFYTLSLIRNSDIDRKNYILENFILLAVAVLIFLITPVTLGKIIMRIAGIVTLAIGIVFIGIEVFKIVKTNKNEITVSRDEVVVRDDDTEDAEEKSDGTDTENPEAAEEDSAAEKESSDSDSQ